MRPQRLPRAAYAGPKLQRTFWFDSCTRLCQDLRRFDILVDHRRRRHHTGRTLGQGHARPVRFFGDVDRRVGGRSGLRWTATMHEGKSRIEAGAATHVGKVRHQNEDNYLVATQRGLWAVADGMGGHEAGDTASRVVVEELAAVSIPATASELLASCEQHIVSANSRLKRLGDERGALVGTTVAVLLIFDGHYAIVWSGDSRIYRVRNHQIEQISVDHTEVQELISEGKLTEEEARAWPRRNVITRAIGVSDDPELEIKGGSLEPGDTFVICSDGLTAHIEDERILVCAFEGERQKACDLLVDLTLDRGAVDNVTVVAIRFDPAGAAATPAPCVPPAPTELSPASGGGLGRGPGEVRERASRNILE